MENDGIGAKALFLPVHEGVVVTILTEGPTWDRHWPSKLAFFTGPELVRRPPARGRVEGKGEESQLSSGSLARSAKEEDFQLLLAECLRLELR